MKPDAMVTVGRIVRPHGIKGAVVVEPTSDFAAERFKAGSVLQWQRLGQAVPVTVVESRDFKGRWVVRLEGVTTISEAEALRGLDLEVPADARHPLKAGAYYMDELEGCEVVTSAGEVVGQVTSVDSAVGTPVLVVRGDAGEVLVPLAEEICRVVDPAAKRIVIDPPAGLIELNAARSERAARASHAPGVGPRGPREGA
jgi:16S rRNA processing protein RimM